MERAVRAWATFNAQAKSAVEAVDAERIRYLRKLLGDAGVPPQAAETRARIINWAYLGFALSSTGLDDESLKSVVGDLSQLARSKQQPFSDEHPGSRRRPQAAPTRQALTRALLLPGLLPSSGIIFAFALRPYRDFRPLASPSPSDISSGLWPAGAMSRRARPSFRSAVRLRWSTSPRDGRRRKRQSGDRPRVHDGGTQAFDRTCRTIGSKVDRGSFL